MQSPKKIFFILILAINAFLPAASQDIIEFEVHFTQHNVELKEKIKYNNSLLLPGEAKTELESIYRQMHDLGFLETALDSCQYDSLLIRCVLIPGNRFRYYITPGRVSEEVLTLLSNDKYFKPYGITPGEYEMLIKEILGFYENRGYPFASARLDSPVIEGDSILGTLFIDHSYYIVFDTLNVKGYVNISPRFLAMHTGVKPGKSYREDVLNNLENRLRSLDFVEITNDPQVVFTNTHAKVEVGLKQKGANRFDGIAGVVYEEAAKNALRLTGQLNLFLTNILERGEWMDLKWQGLGHGTQSLDISAAYPYLFYTPFSAEMQFMMRKQDSTYLHIKRVPALGYRFQSNIRANIFVDWRTSELLDVSRYEDAARLPDFIDYKTIFYGVGASYRSDLFNIEPREGFNYKVQFAAGSRNIRKNINLPDHLYEDIKLNTTQYTGMTALQRIFPLMDRSAILLKGEGGIIIGDDVFDNELFRVGGLHSLRGFDEESIIASAYVYFLAEYRYVTGPNTFLSLFANGGFIERKTARYYNDWPFGAGAGISQETPAGILSLFFALGKRQDEQLNFNDIKVHVGFVSTF